MKDNWELNEAPPSARCDGIEMSKRERKIQNKKYCENAHKPMGSFERVKLVVEREKMREIRAKMKIFIEKNFLIVCASMSGFLFVFVDEPLVCAAVQSFFEFNLSWLSTIAVWWGERTHFTWARRIFHYISSTYAVDFDFVKNVYIRQRMDKDREKQVVHSA